jgi:hypothetical protein
MELIRDLIPLLYILFFNVKKKKKTKRWNR